MSVLSIFFEKSDSSFISELHYDEVLNELSIVFRNGYPADCTYSYISMEIFQDFLYAPSKGRYYLDIIKPLLKVKKQIMAKPDKVIKINIDVTKLNKDWFFVGKKNEKTGETPVYANLTLLFSETQDIYSNNGMVVQDVPKAIYTENRDTKGPILGNAKVWDNTPPAPVAKPGEETGTMGAKDEVLDDLPF